mmetsp:Transcript_59843/g.139416  ORF Transcript_59843/g.139416 Transcript_59843/m.139416 type:complete len:217 (-) Transcript_59843:426-1076(-)
MIFALRRCQLLRHWTLMSRQSFHQVLSCLLRLSGVRVPAQLCHVEGGFCSVKRLVIAPEVCMDLCHHHCGQCLLVGVPRLLLKDVNGLAEALGCLVQEAGRPTLCACERKLHSAETEERLPLQALAPQPPRNIQRRLGLAQSLPPQALGFHAPRHTLGLHRVEGAAVGHHDKAVHNAFVVARAVGNAQRSLSSMGRFIVAGRLKVREDHAQRSQRP